MAQIRSHHASPSRQGSASGGASIRIIVADDQAIVRRGIASLLKLTQGFDVVGEAEDGTQAVALARRLKPDVVLMDLAMPRLNGVEAASRIKSAFKSVKIIILSAHDAQELVMKAIESGADGYILKNSTPEGLAEAVRAVVQGNIGFYSPSFSPETIELLRHKIDHTFRHGSDLTPREKEVLQLIAEGRSHQDIAQLLDLSVRTVDTHRNNLMQKLEIHDAVALVRYAMKEGMVRI